MKKPMGNHSVESPYIVLFGASMDIVPNRATKSPPELTAALGATKDYVLSFLSRHPILVMSVVILSFHLPFLYGEDARPSSTEETVSQPKENNAAPVVPIQSTNPVPPVAQKSVLQVSSDKKTYAHGEVMEITIVVPRNGFLRLYGVSADGSTAMLFPNKWAKDDKVTKGDLVLPAADATYDFVLTLNEGQTKVTESVHAVFSPQPFADSGAGSIRFGSAEFETLGVTNPEQRKTRGLTPTARATSASVEMKYDLQRDNP